MEISDDAKAGGGGDGRIRHLTFGSCGSDHGLPPQYDKAHYISTSVAHDLNRDEADAVLKVLPFGNLCLPCIGGRFDASWFFSVWIGTAERLRAFQFAQELSGPIGFGTPRRYTLRGAVTRQDRLR